MTMCEITNRAEKAIEMYEQNHSIVEISKAVDFHPSFLIRLFENYEEGKAIGKMITTRDTIENMLRYERSVEEIIEITKASMELIEEIRKGDKMTENEYVEQAKKAIEMYKQKNPIEEISLAVGLTSLELENLFEHYEDGKREGRSMGIKLCAAFEKELPFDAIANEFGIELSKVQEMYERYLVEMSEEGE